jgi:mannose-1-phosphate guanylyltransferase
MKLIILAGGSGTRLWPVSRKNSPKQIKPIIGDETLLENTFARLRKGFPVSDIFISTSQVHAAAIKKQLKGVPRENYILEPARRDTAAAIGLALVTIYKRDKEAIVMNINSDHHIKNDKEYIKIVSLTQKIIKEHPDAGVLIGVNPTYPETGYGYIKMGDEVGTFSGVKVFKIAEFKEKPSLEKAKEYLEGWEYLWNMGCFAWRADVLLGLYKKHLPEMHRQLMKIYRAIGTKDERAVTEKEFSKIKPISMDYGIIEKVSKLLVIPADFGWADVGHWRTVKEILSNKSEDSVKKGKVIDIDSSGNLIYSYSNKLVALAGVENMIVIETKDAILICARDKAQDVKKLVEKLKAEGLDKYL